MKRSEINAEAQRLMALGIRWAHEGRTTIGADCIGFVILHMIHFDIPYVDMKKYSRAADGVVFLGQIRKFLDLGQLPLKVGQIAVMRDSNNPCHCGIITERYGQLRLTHSSLASRRVIETVINDDFWKEFLMVFEFPGVEED